MNFFKFQAIVNCEGGGLNSNLLSIVKVGSIVEEATRMGKRSDKMREEKRREAEEKVVWRFPEKLFLTCIFSGGELCQVFQRGEGEAAQLVVEQ